MNANTFILIKNVNDVQLSWCKTNGKYTDTQGEREREGERERVESTHTLIWDMYSI